MTFEKLLYELVGDVAFIRFNDPATLNAMSVTIGRELLAALDLAESEARAVVLGGVGRGFCSGANLAEGGIDLTDKRRDMGVRLEGVLNAVVLRMRASPLPVVTAVRGPAAGVGCAFALAGDLIVAGESALFYQAFSKIGLAPDGGSSYLLTRAIGRPRAMEMMLLGSKVAAAQALEWGLINRVVTDTEVDDTALSLAAELAAGPASIAIIKRVAWAAMDTNLEGALSNERFAQREAGRTEDLVEGVASFREKRKPAFKGR